MLSQRATRTSKQTNVSVPNPKHTDTTEEPTNLLFFLMNFLLFIYILRHTCTLCYLELFSVLNESITPFPQYTLMRLIFNNVTWAMVLMERLQRNLGISKMLLCNIAVPQTVAVHSTVSSVHG